jgi:hypothetical protein
MSDLAGRPAVLAPGGGYGTDGPLLMFASVAVRRRGGLTHPVQWDLPADADSGQLRQMVLARVAAAVDEITAAVGREPVVIGKSLGSLAAPVVADRGLAAVWFTPLLTDSQTVAALRRAPGPCLLVGGTGDEYWDGQVARSVTTNVCEVDDADHGMFVPGPLAASAAVLGRVEAEVEHFLDQLASP